MDDSHQIITFPSFGASSEPPFHESKCDPKAKTTLRSALMTKKSLNPVKIPFPHFRRKSKDASTRCPPPASTLSASTKPPPSINQPAPPPPPPPPPHPRPFRFLDLPPEIRTQIYQLLLLSSTPIPLLKPDPIIAVPWFPSPKPSSTTPALITARSLFLISHLINKEATHIYFTQNTFFLTPALIPASLKETFGPDSCSVSNEHAFLTNLALIRHWHIDVSITKFTFKDNLHASLSLQSFWRKQGESGVPVHVSLHLRLDRETRWEVERSGDSVGRLLEDAVRWWRDSIVKGPEREGPVGVGLEVRLHVNTGPDFGVFEAAKKVGFTRVSRQEEEEVFGARREEWEWVLKV